jgi:hypothetical protein
MCTRILAFEFPNVIAVSLSPGWTRTRLGGPSATYSMEEAGAKNVAVIKNLKPEHSGKWITLEGAIEKF